MKNIIVLGGAGVLGRSLIDAIDDGDHKIVSIDNRKQELYGSSNIVCLEMDITACAQHDNLRKLLEGADAVFYKIGMLGNPAVSADHRKAKDFLDVNAKPLIRVIEALRESRVQHLVVDSSIAAISQPNNGRDMPEDRYSHGAMNYYGASKLVLEDLVHYYSRSTGFSTWLLRYPRVNSTSAKNVIYYFCKAMIGDAQVKINGNPSRTFDFVDISDVTCFNKAIIAQNSVPGLTTCHLTCGEPITLAELASRVASLANAKEALSIKHSDTFPTVLEPLENNLSMDMTRRHFRLEKMKSLDQMIVDTFRFLTTNAANKRNENDN